MTRGIIAGWTKVAARPPGAREALAVAFRKGDERWLDIAGRYWMGALPGLRHVRSSPWAEVQYGILSDGTACYFKRFLVRDWRDRLKHMVRSSRARRALIGGERTRRLGFNVPRPLCLIEGRSAGLLRSSVLVTEALPDAPDVRAWINRPELGVAGDRVRKREFLRVFGREVGALHAAGLYHGDMRLGNILCRLENGVFHFVWLDNERTRLYARLPRRRRVHNLMQVNMDHYGMTLTDRMRFWRAYAEAAHVPPEEGRTVMRRAIRLTQKRWKRRGLL